MSRICGQVTVSPSGHIDPRFLDTLVEALRHHVSYPVATVLCPSQMARMACVGLPGGEKFGTTYVDGDIICVAVGYAANTLELAREIEHETGMAVGSPTLAGVISSYLRDWNLAAFEKFNGLWAFAAWDRRHARLYLGVDRYGIRPLYYRHQGDQVVFASEIKAISHSANDLKIDRIAVEDLLVLGTILGDRTLYRGVQRVPAATILQFDAHGRLDYRYWWFDRLHIDPSLTVQDFIEENARLFGESVARLSPLASTAVSMLSSGFDSRRIVLELRKHTSPRTYTSSVQMSNQKFETDTLIARALCAELGLSNISVDLYDPVIEPELTHLASILLDSETNQHRWVLPLLRRLPIGGGVNFDGLGGDILLFGKQVVTSADRMDLDRGDLPHSITVEFGPALSTYLRRKGDNRPIADRICAQLDLIPPSPYQVSLWFVSQWTRRRTSLFGQGLLSLKMESVYPFMDNDYFALCYRLAPEHKVNFELQGEILRHQYPELMTRIPSSHYPAIGTSPDDHCRPYVRPIPVDYAPRRRYQSSLATARAIAGTPGMLARLSPACLAVTLGVWLVGKAMPATSALIERGWRLEPLDPLLRMYRTLNDHQRLRDDLDMARRFIFGGNE